MNNAEVTAGWNSTRAKRIEVKPRRNDPCGCGSGKKYKKCCAERDIEASPLAVQTVLRAATIETVEVNRLLPLANAGRHADLERGAQALLMQFPACGPAWRLLGLAQWMQGKDALPALQRTAELLPEDADAHSNLGSGLRGQGRLAEAILCYQRAIEIRPDFAEAHNNLGCVHRDQEQLDEAAARFRRALAARSDFALAHCNLGHVLRSLGQFGEAARHYRRAAEIQPDLVDAHAGLGNALQDLGKPEQALHSHRRAQALRPNAAESHQNVGNTFLDLWRLDEAEVCFRRALELEPLLAEAHNKLGAALRLKSRAAEAEACCRQALEINPQLLDALIGLAQLLSDRGEFAEAETTFRQVIAIAPDSADAWAGIVGLRKMTGDDADWLREAERIAATALPPRREAKLRFAIGKYFDDVGEYGRAFESYRRANEISKLHGVKHDHGEVTREFDRIVQCFDAPWVSAKRTAANSSSRPVFVVGMPRSGTTLTEQILAAHPAVFGAGEVPFWGPALRKVAFPTMAGETLSLGRNGVTSIGDSAVLEGLGIEYLGLLETLSAYALRVIDKMPANFKCLGLIHAVFPEARIIHVQRHPIDTCLSIYFQDFNSTHSYASDLGDLAHYYTEYLRLMQHWRSVLPEDAVLDLPYDSLTADPETWTRKMLEFIGLPWNSRCLAFNEQAKESRTILTFSQWQARQKISRTSVARWRRYAEFVEPLLGLVDADVRADANARVDAPAGNTEANVIVAASAGAHVSTGAASADR